MASVRHNLIRLLVNPARLFSGGRRRSVLTADPPPVQMIRATYFFVAAAFFVTATPALAQSVGALASPYATALSPTPAVRGVSTPNASALITTRLSTVILDEPANEEGFATVRIADEAGEAVYRSMIPVAAGARSIDLSAVNIPAAGRHTLRIVYPGGTFTREVETVYTTTAASGDALAGR